MSRDDCRVALLETGLFGRNDEDALENIENVLDSITSNPEHYTPDGKLDEQAVKRGMQSALEQMRIAKRKDAVKAYKSRRAFKENQAKINTWKEEYKAQTGKDVPISRLFEAIILGWNGKQTLTGGKVSVETISAQHMTNYMRDLTDGLDVVINSHGDHIKPLLGVQGNILSDTYRGIKDLINGNLTAARRDFNLKVMMAMEGADVGDPIAKDVAKVLSSTYKKIAEDINKAGGNININENYHPHAHNAEAMLAAGKDEWKTEIRQRINWGETYPEAFAIHKATMQKTGGTENFADSDFADEFLENVYYNVTTGTRNEFSFNESAGKFSSRASRKFERARTIKFTSPEDYATYANRFSTVDAISVALMKIRTASSTRAAMEVLGPVPEDTLNALKKQAEQDLRAGGKSGKLSDKEIDKQLKSLRFDATAGTGRIGGMFHTTMGYSDLAINNNVSKFMGEWRGFNRMKLGSMNIAALFGDTLSGTVQAKRVKGTPNNVFEVFITVANRFDWRDKEMVDALALEGEEFYGAMYNRFDSPESLIENKRLMNRFMAGALRWTGTRWITDVARQSSQRVHMRALAGHKAKVWNELHPDVQHDMRQAGITDTEWNISRKYTETADSGREYFLPRNVQKISNKEIDALLPSDLREGAPKRKTKAWTERRNEARAQIKDELEAKWKRYFIVGDRYAVIQMSDRAKYWATGGGAKKGTPWGETARVIGQFKMQPIEASNLVFREGRAGSTSGGMNSVVANLGFLGTSLLMGYATMTAKDLIGNRTPRDLTESKTYMDAMSYSGGMGFMWDVMTNDIQTYGNPFSPFGPVAGDFGEGFMTIWDVPKVMMGEMTLEEYGKKAGGRAYKVMKGWVPRLWFLRTAMDYYLFKPLEEEIHPGTLRKRERRMKRRTGQEYLLGKPAHDWR